jgi:hypothetical protein
MHEGKAAFHAVDPVAGYGVEGGFRLRRILSQGALAAGPRSLI